MNNIGQTLEQKKQSFKALKPKAFKSLNSVKALMLVIKTKLNDNTDTNDNFYYKCAWHLPEATIVNIIERSAQAKNPKNYFMAAAKRELYAN